MPEPVAHNRRTSGISKGAGSFANLVQYGVAGEAYGSGAVYDPSGSEVGVFKIATDGVYAVTLNAAAAAAFSAEINVGRTVTSTLSTATKRAVAVIDAAGGGAGSCSWTGYCQAGEKIWALHSATPSADVEDNQITIVKVA